MIHEMSAQLLTILAIMEAIAVFSCAISGFAEARKQHLDPVGAFVLAFATAFGGGTLRDVLLDHRPFYWVQHQWYTVLILVLSLSTSGVLRLVSRVATERVLLITDAVGLGFFSASGTSLALQTDMSAFMSVMMGVITGVGGGVMRDILCNEVPLVLRDTRPYAVCAFIGGWIYIALTYADIDPVYSLSISALSVIVVRLLTVAFDVRLTS
ncbi:trimeric intracellular cation channel family protein [Pandoraea nosoerga]|uniref:Trimeric intracellular cation channel family protein n=2 Tax=Pandoraea nosoerga TaxID=2508296 RepID=A0A5E4W144_9BURK|nr:MULTISPECIES: trimeric intracellular cation channel family protein [Pandoraea]MBN4666283.1 trimeric intracellular cation channel family protein [Pandoraea nosoerga]MBN4676338.1 trimeric intracellular cation channel family protein [Pandoraea nosoerga]MBN4681375.1 trimeric intracellular cation channel family protein [Pandoraea nosoerga]MBN4745449.1 trimeric intracellular cation channel family protein [Pandoraea nosoerga]VVE18607.1 trimeric intracellular cation channel family protein [Pandorae